VEMRAHLAPGAALAVAAGLIVLLGEWLGLDMQAVGLLGAALGGVVGLVPDRSAGSRLAGFAAGFVLAWVGYAVRAAVLPDITAGRALAAFLVIAACLVVALVAAGRVPLWSMLVGVAAMVGSYEEAYSASPSQFLQTSPSAATTVLLAASFGFVASALLGGVVSAQREAEHEGAPNVRRRRSAQPVPVTNDESVVA
jgi:hypothetical protein